MENARVPNGHVSEGISGNPSTEVKLSRLKQRDFMQELCGRSLLRRIMLKVICNPALINNMRQAMITSNHPDLDIDSRSGSKYSSCVQNLVLAAQCIPAPKPHSRWIPGMPPAPKAPTAAADRLPELRQRPPGPRRWDWSATPDSSAPRVPPLRAPH